MSEFADVIGVPYTGLAKTQQEIRDTTKGKIPRPANWKYGEKLPEWEPAQTHLSRDEFIRQCQPTNDRILVQLIREKREGSIVLTDPEPLIGGCRKAVVLKTGPGRWIPGEWWKVAPIFSAGTERIPMHIASKWEWFPGYRRPVDLLAGQIVLIGNWTDLEIDDIALCQEGDVRTAWD